MNTGQRNTQGRVIFRGPRGGEYVLGAGGRKIRTFARASAAAVSSALANAKAHMNTLPTAVARKAYLRSRAVNMSNANWKALGEYKNTLNYRAREVRAGRAPAATTGNKNILGRVIHRGPRGGEYVIGPGGRKIRTFTRAPAGAAAPAAAALTNVVSKRLAKMLKLGNNEYISKNGGLFNSRASMRVVSLKAYNNARTRAFNKNPKFLKKYTVPYVGPGRLNQALMTKLKLKNSKFSREGKNHRGALTGVHKKVYYNKNGELYYISLNGKKHQVNDLMTQSSFWISNPKTLRNHKRIIGSGNPLYPRSAIPPATPEPRRSSPALLENMMNQIYLGGRGGNVNAGRYTMAERNVLARRLSSSIAHFRQARNAKKAEAAGARQTLRNTGVTGVGAAVLRAKAAAANERVGYYDDAVRAYTRGLRAVKPLTGAVTPRARAMAATPNQYTPAPANVEENVIYMPLNRPHLVVKVPGAGTIYLNPNTFRGLVKNAARVNIAPANIRNWLRMARRNFPNEALFRHPLAAKNVTASHIRFSK